MILRQVSKIPTSQSKKKSKAGSAQHTAKEDANGFGRSGYKGGVEVLFMLE